MTIPSPEDHLEFLTNIQRLLDEGAFVSTYKFALLMALADLAVERGDDSGEPLELTTEDIAVKFIDYYWRQAQPYVSIGRGATGILHQNTGRQARIVTLLSQPRDVVRRPSPTLLQSGRLESLVREVARTIEVMPLWKLQVMGRELVPFLYENTGQGDRIVLREGVAYCLRRFHGLVRNLSQAAWVRFIRNLKGNHGLLGEGRDLPEFLFGSERTSLVDYVPILRDLQDGQCFYCAERLGKDHEVDHFIPWSRYPVDLGHNFVLAHGSCNHRKRDFLAALPHLEHWMRRNQDHDRTLAEFFDSRNLVHNLCGTLQIAKWAYQQADAAGANVWLRKEELVRLDPSWSALFAA